MTSLSDLCIICSDAPTLALQQQAGSLLGQELTARLAAIPDRYDTSYFDIGRAQGGLRRGQVFAALLGPVGPVPRFELLGGTCAKGIQEAADPRAYGAVMSALQPQIDALGAAVVAATPANFLSATRRLVTGIAAPSAAFGFDALFGAGGALSIGAGSWRVQLAGDFATSSPTAPLTVTVQVGGGTITSRQVARGLDVKTHVETDDTVTLGSSQTITVMNSGGESLYAWDAVLRVFPA